MPLTPSLRWGGSAYLCAYAEDGTTILWSWHIWVLGSDQISESNGIYETKDHIAAAQAKANAEAIKRFGMHYQWGRKDPFTPRVVSGEVQIYNANGTAITKGTNGIGTSDEQFKLDNTIITTINHLIQNPSTYYVKGDGTNRVPIASAEYYKDTKEGDWWNPTIKTIYDPCPNGYRIPKNGTYGNTNNSPDWTLSTWTGSVLTAGHSFNKTTPSFFPTSGYRSASSGNLGGVGSNGYSWMSTPYNPTTGYYLNFSSNNVGLNRSSARSSGFPTRCIKE